MTNLIGKSLGRYHIIEQLGEGGMAIVYKAYDTRLETEVAVKVIRTENLAPAILEKAIKRFEREAKALARLTHPNIVKVTDYGEFEGKPYIVMPYLSGGTLRERIQQGPIPWQEAVRLLLPIVHSLAYAHEQNIIHRDIKPSNILLTVSGEPMLSDFGIAKMLEQEITTELTATNAGIGTPEYMAPEQGMGYSDARSDIYSLGIVLYQMTTSQLPFRADTPMGVLLKKNTEPLPRPTKFIPNLPASVEQTLIKTLERDPNDRYQDARSLINALKALSGREQATKTISNTLTSSPTVVEGFGNNRPPRSAEKGRNKWLLWGTGALFLIASCTIIIGLGAKQIFDRVTSSLPSTPAIEEVVTIAASETATPIVSTEAPLPNSAPETTGFNGDFDLAFVSDRDNQAESMRAYLVNANSPTEYQVFENPTGYERAEWPSFCGSQLAVQVVDLEHTSPQWIYLLNPGNIPAKWLDSAEALEAPRCSPNGRHMAYSALDGEYWDLKIVELNSNNVVYNPDFRQYGKKSGYASWYGDSQSFIFEAVANGQKFFLVNDFPIDPSWSELERFEKNAVHATVSPDGKKAAYFCFVGDLCILDLDRKKVQAPIYQTKWSVDVDWSERGAPVWSADGQWIYFPTMDGGDWDIFRIHPNGEGVENITLDWPSNEMYPATK